MQPRNHPDLLTGSINKNIIRMSLPMIVAMLFQTGFSVIDMIFVGKVSPEAIAAVSIVFPVMFFFVSFVMGIGTGLSSFVARAFGAGEIEKAGRIAANGLAFGIILSLLLAVLGVAFSRPLFVLLGAGPEIIASVMDYCRVIFVGFIFIFFGAFGNSIIRGAGDTRTPMKFLLIQTFVNLVLDPLFIFGLGPVPAMGVFGAGLAMVVSRVVLVVLVFRHFISGKSNVVPVVKKFRFDFSLIKEILRIGIPSTITFMSSSIGLMLFMKLVSGYGPLAIAAFGIGGRVENIAILPALGMSGAILTIVGQNYGARKLERAQKTIRNSMLLLALFMLSVAGVSLLFAKPIVSIFTQNTEVVALSVDFLYIRAPFWAFMGVRMIIGAGFNGVGNPKVGLLTLLFGLFAVGLPAAMVLQASLGLNAVWLGLSLANLSGTIAAYGIYRWRFPKGREHGA
ncbi:MAG: MATE family efflux transporter [Deltaproteobacteria bacterium]|nr:MATE family efflux transporter [Deltaproteobacteria bacterium]MBW2175572.1 MATE family efflux transporter [Deltaproteobacteria bacterium]MBW2677313.1 MATE family efflux transporter [Deltaproteobacteria bacterium]